jgi:hypothetical protein
MGATWHVWISLKGQKREVSWRWWRIRLCWMLFVQGLCLYWQTNTIGNESKRHWSFCAHAMQEAKDSCHKLTREMKPGSAILNLNPNGFWCNGATWHPQGWSAPSVFRDEKSVSPVNSVPKGTAVKPDRYCEGHLRLVRPTRNMSELLLYHDYGMPHTHTRARARVHTTQSQNLCGLYYRNVPAVLTSLQWDFHQLGPLEPRVRGHSYTDDASGCRATC